MGCASSNHTITTTTIIQQTTTLAQVNGLGYYAHFSNSNLGFSIDYPVNWTSEQSTYSTYGDTFQDKQGAGLLVDVEPLNGSRTVEDITNSLLALFSQRPNLKVIGDKKTILSGLPAHEITFTTTGPSTGVVETLHMTWTTAFNSSYTITYTGANEKYQENQWLERHMLDSFSIETAPDYTIPSK